MYQLIFVSTHLMVSVTCITNSKNSKVGVSCLYCFVIVSKGRNIKVEFLLITDNYFLELVKKTGNRIVS